MGEPADDVVPDADPLFATLPAEEIRPAFAAYREFLDAEALPCGRPLLVRRYTTTESTPADPHRTGLELIAALERARRRGEAVVVSVTSLSIREQGPQDGCCDLS